jgi:hypothetical protein
VHWQAASSILRTIVRGWRSTRRTFVSPARCGTNPDGQPSGGLWIVDAENKAFVEQLLTGDPFWIQGRGKAATSGSGHAVSRKARYPSDLHQFSHLTTGGAGSVH